MNDNLLSYMLNGLLGTGWLTTAVIGGRKVHQKELVKQLQDLVAAQQAAIELLKAQNVQQQRDLDSKEQRISYLEEIIRDDPDLVRERIDARLRRASRRSSPTNPASTGNG